MSTSCRAMRTARMSLHPVVLTVGAIVMILLFAYMVSTAFKPQAYALETPPKSIPDPGTIDNFVQAWATQNSSRYALNSAFASATSTVLAVWLSSMMACAFMCLGFPCRKWFLRTLLLGLMIPSMMLIIPQFVLMKQLHLIDNPWALVLFYVSGNLALNTFPLRSFSKGIPRGLDEAMEVDGANVWTRYWRPATPLARPALATTVIFTFLVTWDGFAWALTVISTEMRRTLPIAIQLFHGQNSTQWEPVLVASLIVTPPVIVVYLIFQRHSVAGLIAGAVKG